MHFSVIPHLYLYQRELMCCLITGEIHNNLKQFIASMLFLSAVVNNNYNSSNVRSRRGPGNAELLLLLMKFI